MSDAKSNLVLIGMPASGKSTVGVQLAKWKSMGFIDTDLLVQARADESMQAFQDTNGMEAYRTLECNTVGSLVCENCVIATGGSAVYCDGAMQHLKKIATIIFLDVPVEEIKQRIGSITERGVVISPGMTLDDLHAERRPLYLKYADVVIDCSGKPQDELLMEIRRRQLD
jgi:shikimate kinase